MSTTFEQLPLTNSACHSPNNSRKPLTTAQSSMLSDEWQIQTVTTRAAFDQLEADWNDLYARAGAKTNIFQSFNWNWHWCNHYLPAQGQSPDADRTHASGHSKSSGPINLHVVTVRKDGVMVMLWPLVMSRTAGFRQLTWMGDPVSQYGDILVDANIDVGPLLAQTWSYIVKGSDADLLCLRKVRADAIVTPLLEEKRAAIIQFEEAVSHRLDKDGDFETYSKRHKGRALRNRRRQLRRLEELGTVTFEELEPGPRAARVAREAIMMKRQWLVEKQLMSRAYSDEHFDDFFAAIALGDDHPSGCCVTLLSCGEKIAAVEIGLIAKQSRYMHIIVYNLEYERFAAGAQHMIGSIRSSFDRGIATFDLLAPNTPYKNEWGDEITPVCDYAIGLNIKGRAYVWGYLQHLRQGIKMLVEYVPHRIRRILLSSA